MDGNFWLPLVMQNPAITVKFYHMLSQCWMNLTYWGRDERAAIFPDNISKWIFLNENICILIKISLKFVPRSPLKNIPALVQTIAWCRPGDKPLSEPMMVSLVMHICITQPQRVKLNAVGMIAGARSSAALFVLLNTLHFTTWHNSGCL